MARPSPQAISSGWDGCGERICTKHIVRRRSRRCSARCPIQKLIESEAWKNGVFTFALLEGMKTFAADKDKDGKLDEAELAEALRDFVPPPQFGPPPPKKEDR